MKKAVLILAALLLVSSFVFAQDAGIKIGAWGRGILVPAMGGTDVGSILMTSWGPGGARVGMTISGTSPNVGFQADFNVDNKGIQLGDQQKIWVKPIDMVTLQVGMIYDDTLRGSAGSYGAWNWLRYNFMVGDGAVFARLGEGGNQMNAEVAIAPVEGLYIFGGINQILTGLVPNNPLAVLDPGAQPLLKDVVLAGQYGAGYTIAGIGTIRAQYIGADKDKGTINAAFKLSAVDKLSLDVGAFIPVALTDAGKSDSTATITAGASYGLDALTINAMGMTTLWTADSGIDTPQIQVGAGVDYNLGGGLAVNADFRFQNDFLAITDVTFAEWGAMAGVSMGFSNGLIGIALELTNANFADWTADLNPKTNPDDIAWAIPVRFEYWF